MGVERVDAGQNPVLREHPLPVTEPWDGLSLAGTR